MAAAASTLLLLPISPISTSRRFQFRLKAEALPSPRPLTSRRNHLRSKLRIPQTRTPSPPPPPPSHETIDLAELSSPHFAASETSPPTAAADHHLSPPPPPADLVAPFVALLVAQTVASVWFLSGRLKLKAPSGGIEEARSGTDEKRVEMEREVVVEEKEGFGFEERVEEVRRMAREARAEERREPAAAAATDRAGEKAARRLGRKKKKKARAARIRRGLADSEETPVGSGRLKVKDGDDRQVFYQNSTTNPVELHKSRDTSITKSRNAEKNVEHAEDSLSSNVNSIGNTKHDLESPEKLDGSREGSPSQVKPFLYNQNTESSYGTTSNANNTLNSEPGIDDVNHKTYVNGKDCSTVTVEKVWWLKLPFVLGIILHRGADRNRSAGLYCLDLDPSLEDGDSSYTVTFQDRGDATNFCYLLESFFAELGDVSADIAPLTIEELNEVTESTETKAVVVPKGQLKLYAGQPLAEVESTLRSLMD